MKLLVIGSTSHLAGTLLPLLLADGEIQHVIGFDQTESALTDAKYTHITADPKSAQVSHIMSSVDAAVFFSAPSASLEAAENIAQCAQQQHLRCLVYVSSAWVYALPTRERPVAEEHARRAPAGWREIEHAVAVEELLDRLEAKQPRVRVVRLRPSMIVGRGGSPWGMALLRALFTLYFEHPPRLQCVHALDVARAIQQALREDVQGAFNLATSDTATLRDMQRRLHRGWIPLPSGIVQLLSRTAFGRKSLDPACFNALHHELVIDSSRARQRLGWKPEYDTVRLCLKAFNN